MPYRIKTIFSDGSAPSYVKSLVPIELTVLKSEAYVFTNPTSFIQYCNDDWVTLAMKHSGGSIQKDATVPLPDIEEMSKL